MTMGLLFCSHYGTKVQIDLPKELWKKKTGDKEGLFRMSFSGPLYLRRRLLEGVLDSLRDAGCGKNQWWI